MSHIHNIYIYIILISIFCLSITKAQVEPYTSSAHHPRAIIADRQPKQHKHEHGAARRTIITATSTTTTSMPEPYDTLAYNFANTTSCQNFYKTWRANSTITNCHAISLLLENSNAFFHTLSSATSTSRVLDTACAANAATCSTIMTNLAADLIKPSNCGADYANNNAVVKGTYRDLVAYEPMYRATCLTNPQTESYCFADAATNTSSPADYDVYFMPLGSALGGGSTPSCTLCLQATMEVFARWATVNGQALDRTYLPSARVVNAHCGEGFAKTNVTVGVEVVGGSERVGVSGVGVLTVAVLVSMVWLV
jgi:hypothetical protein